MNEKDIKQAKRFILSGLRKNNKKDILPVEFFINLSGLMRIILSKPLECRNCLDWICNTLEYCPYDLMTKEKLKNFIKPIKDKSRMK